MRPPLRVAGLGVALLLVGCSGTAGSPQAGSSGAPVAVATTTMLGSVVTEITTCAGGTTRTLMPVGVDPHEFSLSSADVALMLEAKLVVTNGLGLEAGIASALENVQRDGGNVYEAGLDVDPEKLEDPSPDASLAGGYDPHFWMDVARMAKAADNIGKELAKATGDERYAQCGAQVSVGLDAVDKQVRDMLLTVPKANRVLVTDHDAMGYFAKAYSFSVAAVVIPGGSTDAEPSSRELAAVVQVVKESGVHAIFSNTALSPRLVESVGAEAGGVQVVPLHIDSVGPAGSGAATYADMMTTDARRIADALT